MALTTTFDPLIISKHEEIVNALETLNQGFSDIGNFDNVDLAGVTSGQGLIWNGTNFVAGTVGGLQSGDNISALNNDAGYQTLAQVQAEIASLVDSAPATLDTLNELANALGNDPNFAATITTQLAGKANTVHTHVVADITDFPTLAAVATSGDYNDLSNLPTPLSDTDGLAEGATNLYFTDARVAANPAVVLNTAKISAGGSIGTHSDVDITTNAPANGQVLSWNGSEFVPVNAGVDTNMMTGDLLNTTGNVTHDNGGFAFSIGNATSLQLSATTLARLVGGDTGASFGQVNASAAAANMTWTDGTDTNALQVTSAGLLLASAASGVVQLTVGGAVGLTAAGAGALTFPAYPATRDDSGTTAVGNILYSSPTGALLSAPIASALGSVNNHSDVDTTTAAPVTGDLLRWNGVNWIPATLYAPWHVFAEESGGLNNNSFEYSYGNGDTGDIGVMVTAAMELTHVWIQADIVNATGAVTIVVTLDGVDTAATVDITAGGPTDVINTLGTPLPVPAGVRLGFRTTNYTTQIQSVRVGASGRVPLIVG